MQEEKKRNKKIDLKENKQGDVKILLTAAVREDRKTEWLKQKTKKIKKRKYVV